MHQVRWASIFEMEYFAPPRCILSTVLIARIYSARANDALAIMIRQPINYSNVQRVIHRPGRRRKKKKKKNRLKENEIKYISAGVGMVVYIPCILYFAIHFGQPRTSTIKIMTYIYRTFGCRPILYYET